MHDGDTAVGTTGFLLWQVSNAWQRELRQALAPIGLTYVQSILIIGLATLEARAHQATHPEQPAPEQPTPNKPTQGELATFCEADATMTSQVLQALEDKGLVVRIKGRDARTRYPQVTEEGKELAKQAAAVLSAAEQSFFGPDDKGGLEGNLRKLKA